LRSSLAVATLGVRADRSALTVVQRRGGKEMMCERRVEEEEQK
jgi:hypothetical protein